MPDHASSRRSSGRICGVMSHPSRSYRATSVALGDQFSSNRAGTATMPGISLVHVSERRNMPVVSRLTHEAVTIISDTQEHAAGSSQARQFWAGPVHAFAAADAL